MVCDDIVAGRGGYARRGREVTATVWKQQIGFVNPCELEMELNTTGVASVSHPNRANNHRREEYHTSDSQDEGQLLLKHQIIPFVFAVKSVGAIFLSIAVHWQLFFQSVIHFV